MERQNEEQLEMVAKAFVEHYYNLFDTARLALPSLYNPTSILSFEGQTVHGAEEIGRKLMQLPFDHCRHYVSTIDCQPSPVAGAILVFVSGNLQLPCEEHQLKFSQMFQLVPTQQGSFFVQNDIFRLNYG
ncbi:Nuclear transport factor 2 domain-containing protein [Dioscorea alata]|uniref:Nuclear transport factor 2B-like n=2 Tax=Dioscorea TaxID=4672 RepID=A0AB40AYA9_DIOCR|nr:nuclear transport factor 2B-like [Dioscorea cayenensis subsp. rotundata]KAH7662173.1 Nuclear transport factor 2 domain-containing protein [Dioscorea alata]